MKRIAVILFLLLGMRLEAQIRPAAELTDRWLPLTEGKRVAILANHTSTVGLRHTVDIMVENGVNLVGIVAPEHGFRGNADAGEKVNSGTDARTGIPVWSLYSSKTRSLGKEQIDSFDIIFVDMQDVGLRFYTYYITMLSVMKSVAGTDKEVVILDRPNPNGMYVDGPILRDEFRSGVGALPIPVVHGMTLGELAEMAVGEHWIPMCRLRVIKCEGYSHSMKYTLPIAPSPNLKSQHAIYLYPSTCLFEGTVCSLGRGTEAPFEMYGHPDMKGCGFTFTPRSVSGAKHPPLMDRTCRGVDLRKTDDDAVIAQGFTLRYVMDAYRRMGSPENFFTPFFEKLTGVSYIRKMIEEGREESEIRACWKDELDGFRTLRSKYLLYD